MNFVSYSALFGNFSKPEFLKTRNNQNIQIDVKMRLVKLKSNNAGFAL